MSTAWLDHRTRGRTWKARLGSFTRDGERRSTVVAELRISTMAEDQPHMTEATTINHETITDLGTVNVCAITYEVARYGTRDIDGFGPLDMAGDLLAEIETYAGPDERGAGAGWSRGEVGELYALAARWHLNGMRAGCAHQTEQADELQREALRAIKPQHRTGFVLDNVTPCEETGYRYGSAWLVEPLPADVEAELVRMFTPANR